MINLNECWLFAGYKNDNGYGRIFYTINGKTRYELAHRVSYETFVAPIPDEMVIDHLCSVRHCINPSHLEPVTPSQNTLRGKGVLVNKNKTHCSRGHAFTSENTVIRNNGWRICASCVLIRNTEYYQTNKDKWLIYNKK